MYEDAVLQLNCMQVKFKIINQKANKIHYDILFAVKVASGGLPLTRGRNVLIMLVSESGLIVKIFTKNNRIFLTGYRVHMNCSLLKMFTRHGDRGENLWMDFL